MKVVLLALALIGLALPAAAQSVNIDLGATGQAGATSRLVQLTALIGVMSLASRHPSFWCHIGRNERIGRWAV
jgi:flagellar biosynthetic protein FliP